MDHLKGKPVSGTAQTAGGSRLEILLGLYERMLLIRQFELCVQENYRRGEVPGFIHLCVGQEAVAVGVCDCLEQKDWITSTHRGHGHALAKGVDPRKVLAELYGKETGCNGGRGGSMHLFSVEEGLFGTNGLVGGGLPLATGLGLSAQLQGTHAVAVSFFGDGAICHGAFHESVSLAAIKKLPVVFVCENNLYATCTPISQSNLNQDIAGKAAAYGIPGLQVDGNDVLAVRQAAAQAVARARNGEGPTLIEAITYRTVGHHEGDVIVGTYRTREELEEWKARDPLKKTEEALTTVYNVSPGDLHAINVRVNEIIQRALDFARSSAFPDPLLAAANCWKDPVNPRVALEQKAVRETVVTGWLNAVRDGIAEEMRRDNNIIYLGEGIGERGGTFGHTKNLWQEFGAKRLIDTPICELAFTGTAAAAAATGCRSIADLMFADFIFDAATQIINQISKLRYMSNGQISVPVVIRSGSGQIKQAGPQHSGTFHSVWGHIPGLIVVVPSTPADAKGLIKTALQASDPVIFLEPKSLLSSKGPVPVGEEYIPFGKARLVNEGTDITIISFGQPVLRCLEAEKELRQRGISCEIIDLRTIVPIDLESIVHSINKTGRVLVVDEAYLPFSTGSEIAALVMENCFHQLKAPVGRLGKLSVPQPFSPTLEMAVTITAEKITEAVIAIMEGEPVKPVYLPKRGDLAGDAGLNIKIKEAEKKNDLGMSVPVTGHHRSNQLEVVIPNMGLTITEVTISQWHKKPGDEIRKGEVVLDFESEKSVVELESSCDGRLISVVQEAGATVPIGAVVGYIEERNNSQS